MKQVLPIEHYTQILKILKADSLAGYHYDFITFRFSLLSIRDQGYHSSEAIVLPKSISVYGYSFLSPLPRLLPLRAPGIVPGIAIATAIFPSHFTTKMEVVLSIDVKVSLADEGVNVDEISRRKGLSPGLYILLGS